MDVAEGTLRWSSNTRSFTNTRQRTLGTTLRSLSHWCSCMGETGDKAPGQLFSPSQVWHNADGVAAHPQLPHARLKCTGSQTRLRRPRPLRVSPSKNILWIFKKENFLSQQPQIVLSTWGVCTRGTFGLIMLRMQDFGSYVRRFLARLPQRCPPDGPKATQFQGCVVLKAPLNVLKKKMCSQKENGGMEQGSPLPALLSSTSPPPTNRAKRSRQRSLTVSLTLPRC